MRERRLKGPGRRGPSTGGAAAGRIAGLLLGVALDAIAGDPRRGHPVAAFGRVAGGLERRLYTDAKPKGVLHTGLCVGGAAALGFAADRLAGAAARRTTPRAQAPTAQAPTAQGRGGPPFAPVARAVVTGGATWAVLGGTSLGREGMLMARALEAGDLDAARARLPHLCARDPEGLDAKALARATVESIAENTSDAAVAPLLWGAVGGVPGLLAYRAINTLDAMVGYRNPRYENFGWAAARLDDVANWVPARVTGLLTVACAPFAGPAHGVPKGSGASTAAWARAAARRSRESLAMLRRDGGAHPSPNAGRCEAAFAGALGVRLGGVNAYGGRVEARPELGDGRSPEVADIRRAVRLSRTVTLAAALLSAALTWSLAWSLTRALAGSRRNAGAAAVVRADGSRPTARSQRGVMA